MDYEKLYKDALKKAKGIYIDAKKENCTHTDWLEYIFPELKYNNDEWIQKEIINYFKEKGDYRSCWITWLEKQGEQNSPIFSNSLNIGKNEQKYANKVESKFKVDDWIVRDDHLIIGKVISFDSICYWYNDVTCSCSVKQPLFFNDEDRYHIWTIQDAKDGDVVYHRSPLTGVEYIVMFRGVNGYGSVDSYFRYNSDDGFGINIPSVFSAESDITPATEEQREFLFRKMKEAGYEWDADTKRLKKIGQKPIWSEDDEQNLLQAIYVCHQYEYFEVETWLKSLKDRMQQHK